MTASIITQVSFFEFSKPFMPAVFSNSQEHLVKTDNLISKESNRSFLQRSASFISSLFKIVLIGVISFGAIASAGATPIYVNYQQNWAVGNGQSWETAFNTIADGLAAAATEAAAAPGTPIQIWVAKGDYKMPYNYYPLADKVDIYGGFEGNESEITQRVFYNNLPAQPTTLRDSGFPWISPYPGRELYYPNYVYYDHLFYLKNATNKFDGLRFVGSAGIAQEGGELTVVNSIFTRVFPTNYTMAGNGIFSFNNATLTVTKSQFLNGKANRGGAIAADHAASVTINDSTFDGNNGGHGGAIWINGNLRENKPSLLKGVYGDPRLTKVAITNNVFANGSAGSAGGAISIKNPGPVLIQDNKFINNKSNYLSGGAIEIATDGSDDEIAVSLDKAEFINNVFTNNSAMNKGGAIIIYRFKEVIISGSTFGDAAEISAKGNNSMYGGAICSGLATNVTISGSVFYGNQATSGGAIIAYGHQVYGNILITNSKFQGNNATYGGAISSGSHLTGTGAKTVRLDIKSNDFLNNTVSALGRGPAIYYDSTEGWVNGRNLTVNAFSKSDLQAIKAYLKRDNLRLNDSDIYAPPPP
ncbi:MAG: hypothetical protein K0R08_158 [Solimicrobium sp.]|nr:hypothetical protein [Solimicrobium sp.]